MITADKRKAVFLLHQEGVSKRAIARQLHLSRNVVRRIIAQSGQMPPPIRPPRVVLAADRLRQLHRECEGYAQRMTEKLREEHGITVKYSTLTRHLRHLEDLNRQALAWSTVRMEQRPQGKAGLIPAQTFEHERHFLTPLPSQLPAPYQLLERSVAEYGYVAVDGNYYEMPGSGRGQVQVLRYLHHVVLGQERRPVIEYALRAGG